LRLLRVLAVPLLTVPFLLTLESAMEPDSQPHATPPAWTPPPRPPAPSPALLEQARQAASRHVHGGRPCVITAFADSATLGPYTRHATFIADERGLSLIGEPKGDLLLAPGRGPGEGPDILFIGTPPVPMTRAQLRRLMEESPYPVSLDKVGSIVVQTSVPGFDQSLSGDPQGQPPELAGRVRHPEVSGTRGDRRFAFDARGPTMPRARVTVRLDGEGPLEPVVVPLLGGPSFGLPGGPPGVLPGGPPGVLPGGPHPPRPHDR
jgi:hypothetical protein